METDTNCKKDNEWSLYSGLATVGDAFMSWQEVVFWALVSCLNAKAVFNIQYYVLKKISGTMFNVQIVKGDVPKE